MGGITNIAVEFIRNDTGNNDNRWDNKQANNCRSINPLLRLFNISAAIARWVMVWLVLGKTFAEKSFRSAEHVRYR